VEKPVGDLNETDIGEQPGMIVVPRVAFNYVVIAISFLLIGILMGAIGYERFGTSNQEMVEQAVQRAIGGNGLQDLVNESVSTALESQQAAAQPRRLDPNQQYDIPVNDNPAVGPEDAPVTIVEFSDFQCGYCGRFARETLQNILTNYEGKVRFVYRDYVIFGQASYQAALASECANDQGKWLEYHNLLFTDQQSGFSRDELVKLASDIDLDTEQFASCYDDETHGENVNGDVSFGQELGISGTPTFFINGHLVSGAQPYDVFARVIDQELVNAGVAPEQAPVPDA
jgi:protein-disulfide isomerase